MERDPYEGLDEGIDFPSRTLQLGYGEELWRHEEEWERGDWKRFFGDEEETGKN